MADTVSGQTVILPDPSLIVLIGVSGAGKSTFAARHFSPTEVISSDHCRALISDDDSNQAVTAQAFLLLDHIARERLKLRRMTVIDATNLESRFRRTRVEMAHSAGVPATALVFKVEIDIVMRNNRTRQTRIVPEAVILVQLGELELAALQVHGEGFDAIFEIKGSVLDSIRVERIVV